MNQLPRDRQIQAIAALTEGCSIRATERLTGIHRDTIMRLGVQVGEGCERLHHALFRDLNIGLIQLDEQWAFIGKKEKRVTADDLPEKGDCYLFIALDATHKAVVSFKVGKRDGNTTLALVRDLRARVLNRPQITADGFPAYPPAIDLVFERDVDFATIQKVYAADPGHDAAHRYSPGRVIGIEKEVRRGTPDEAEISTSYVERFNLTTLMQMRRFTRLTSGFSKRLRNHRAAIALHIAAYNLCRVHETIRVTPAMALGVTDHIWTLGELVDAALSMPTDTPTPAAPIPTTGGSETVGRVKQASKADRARPRPNLRVIKGGRK